MTSTTTIIPVVVILDAPVPAGATREALRSAFASTLEFNGKMPAILQKYYTYDEATSRLGSVYLWRSREEALNFFSDGWDARFEEKWGTRPSMKIMDAIFVLRTMPSMEAA